MKKQGTQKLTTQKSAAQKSAPVKQDLTVDKKVTEEDDNYSDDFGGTNKTGQDQEVVGDGDDDDGYSDEFD